MAYYEGSKVRLEADDSVYEGIIHNVDPIQHRISLKKVIVLPGGKKLTGLHNFFQTDIKSLELIDDDDDDDDDTKTASLVNTPSRNSDTHTNHCDKQVDSEAYQSDASNQLPTRTTEYNNSETMSPKLSERKVNNREFLATNLPLIAALDDDYFEAIEILKAEKTVGFSMEGVELGRDGKVSIVQFSTKDSVYLFHIKQLGRKAFSNGIGDIIESDEVLKVIHDCRSLSDLLYHEYGLTLRNVFDTQVADTIVYKHRHSGRAPIKVKSLPDCLMEYLPTVKLETVNFILELNKCIKRDPLLWEEHTLDSKIVRYADYKVRSLLKLHDKLDKCMREDFEICVKDYLRSYRDKISTRKKEVISAYTNVPKPVTTEYEDVQSNEEKENDMEFFDRESIRHPAHWSRDSWREGSQFTEEDENEKYEWYREMKRQQKSSIQNDDNHFQVPPRFKNAQRRDVRPYHNSLTEMQRQEKPSIQRENHYELPPRFRKAQRKDIQPIKTRTNEENNSFHSDQDMAVSVRPNLSDGSSSDNGITSRQLTISNEESSVHSSPGLPSSSDNDMPLTTSIESSPQKSSSVSSSPYRTLADSMKSNSPKTINSQIRTLTLKEISNTIVSSPPPPLIASDGSSSVEEETQRVPSIGQPVPSIGQPVPSIGQPVPTYHLSYAGAVSGEKSTSRSTSSPGNKMFKGRGRGSAIKSFRQLPGNFQRKEESPVAILHGNAVRCDFPSDSVFENTPQGIVVSKDSQMFGVTH